MKAFIKKNKLTFFILGIINLIISIIASFILPKRFFYDALTIVLDKYHEIGLIGGYPFSMYFYKMTGLRNLPFPIIAIIQFPILFYLLYKIGVPKKFNLITVKNVIVYLGFLMMAIFISMPSKEFITFTYLSLIPFVFQSKNIITRDKIIISMFLFLFFAFFFRPYFVFIPVLSIAMYIFSFVKLKNKTISSVSYGLCIAIFLSLSYGLVTKQFLSQASREDINSDRNVLKDANSMIVSPVSTDTWYGESVGIVYGFFAVNVPVEGIKHLLSPQILAFIFWQLFLFYIFLVRLSNALKNKQNDKEELWLLFIIFSYFIIQGIFEPDLGSAIRHKIGVFPLLYFALYYDEFNSKSFKKI